MQMARLARKAMAWLPDAMRLRLGRRMLRFQPGPRPLQEVRIARTRGELEGAFTLLHDAYVSSGFMKPHPSGMRITAYHALPTTTTAIALFDGKIAGTVSLVRDTPFGLPLDSAFDIGPLRATGARIFEVSSLAVAPEFRNRGSEVAMALMRYIYRYAVRRAGVDRFVFAVNPRHVDMYRTLFDAEEIPGARVENYAFASGAPAVGLTLDLRALLDFWRKAFPALPVERDCYHYFVDDEAGDAGLPQRSYGTVADPVLTPDLFDHFFNQKTALFSELPPAKLRALSWIFDAPAFRQVVPAALAASQIRKERRVEGRFEAALPARLMVGDGEQQHFALTTLVDVSRSGFCMTLAEELPLGRDVALRASLSQFDLANLRARPVWREGRRYGFRITVADAAWADLIAHIEQATYQSSPPADPATRRPSTEALDAVRAGVGT